MNPVQLALRLQERLPDLTHDQVSHLCEAAQLFVHHVRPAPTLVTVYLQVELGLSLAQAERQAAAIIGCLATAPAEPIGLISNAQREARIADAADGHLLNLLEEAHSLLQSARPLLQHNWQRQQVMDANDLIRRISEVID